MNIGILLDNTILTSHWGVLHYLLTFAEHLESLGNKVYFIKQDHTDYGTYSTYLISFTDKIRPVKADFVQNVYTSPFKDNLYRSVFSKSNRVINYTQTGLDETFQCLDISILIVGAPWIMVSNKIKNIVNMGICFDNIPSEYTIGAGRNIIKFASQHHNGYSNWNQYFQKVLFISLKSQDNYEAYYKNLKPNQHSVIPPLGTAIAYEKGHNINKTGRSLCLCAPFDPRKGVVKNMLFLKSILPCFDNILIYGSPRCEEKYFLAVMEIFKDTNTTWYKNPTDKQAASIYWSSDYLFFPSENEGLGLPIIESQVHGCRVIIHDRAPMNQLAMDAAFFLTDSAESDAIRFKSELNNNFDRNQLAKKCRDKFLNIVHFENWWNNLINSL